jgi:hypothetical protein
MKRIICFFLMLSLAACSAKESAPSNVLPESKMKSVLWDVTRAQFLAEHNARRDSAINLNAETRLLTEKVFGRYKITSGDFERSYNWYTSHPDQLQVLLDSLYTQKQREFNPEIGEPGGKDRKLLKRTIEEKPISNE